MDPLRNTVIIEPAGSSHLVAWSRLRAALWPSETARQHQAEIERDFLASPERNAAFLALSNDVLIGFAEAAIRTDYVNGCNTSPVVFLEGIYVTPEFRRLGIATALCASVEAWGRQAGCTEFASDAALDNTVSHNLHCALGFAETERVVFFRKRLAP